MINNQESLRLKLEELEIPSHKIDEIIASLEADQKNPTSDTQSHYRFELANQIAEEKDWRKRASLAARLIGLGFE